MSKQEDKTVKTNGTSDPMQRLASLKAPRDLTLGGNKTNKKVFVPNLNAARNKNKGPQPTTKEQKKEDKGRKDRKNDRNRNNRNGPSIIKSAGVFSQGLGNSEKQHYSRSSYGGGGRDSESTTLQKPTIRIKDVIKIDKELEEQKVKSVLAGGGAYDEDVEDFKQGSERDAPVKLPMDHLSYQQGQAKKKVHVKQEVLVKIEADDDADCAITDLPKVNAAVDIKTDGIDDTDVVDVLRSDKPTLILLQLPDSLPGRGGDDGPRRDRPSHDDNDDQTEDERCRLSDLEEGRIGKLSVHRSGRVTLTLGHTVFEVCSGTKASFYQEAVSVASDDASRSANIVALGPLQHKLSLVPHWETIFQDLPS